MLVWWCFLFCNLSSLTTKSKEARLSFVLEPMFQFKGTAFMSCREVIDFLQLRWVFTISIHPHPSSLLNLGKFRQQKPLNFRCLCPLSSSNSGQCRRRHRAGFTLRSSLAGDIKGISGGCLDCCFEITYFELRSSTISLFQGIFLTRTMLDFA